MKKVFLKVLSLFAMTSGFLFANSGNIASKLADSFNENATEVGTSVASVINTGYIVAGVLWLCVVLFMAFFYLENLKNYAKQVIGAVVIIGIIYGLSYSAM